MTNCISIIDQTPKVWASVDISDEIAEHLRDSPVGTLRMFEQLVGRALEQAGVWVDQPLKATINGVQTSEI